MYMKVPRYDTMKAFCKLTHNIILPNIQYILDLETAMNQKQTHLLGLN